MSNLRLPVTTVVARAQRGESRCVGGRLRGDARKPRQHRPRQRRKARVAGGGALRQACVDQKDGDMPRGGVRDRGWATARSPAGTRQPGESAREMHRPRTAGRTAATPARRVSPKSARPVSRPVAVMCVSRIVAVGIGAAQLLRPAAARRASRRPTRRAPTRRATDGGRRDSARSVRRRRSIAGLAPAAPPQPQRQERQQRVPASV